MQQNVYADAFQGEGRQAVEIIIIIITLRASRYTASTELKAKDMTRYASVKLVGEGRQLRTADLPREVYAALQIQLSRRTRTVVGRESAAL